MRTKALLLSAMLFFGLFFAGNGLAGGQVFAEEAIPSERMKAFFNGSSVITIQCYQVVIPDGWEAQTFLLVIDPSEETGFLRTDTENKVICFALYPKEIKWLSTAMKRTGSFNNKGAAEIKYRLYLRIPIYPEVHKKPASFI
jgi:hypothetical protein